MIYGDDVDKHHLVLRVLAIFYCSAGLTPAAHAAGLAAQQGMTSIEQLKPGLGAVVFPPVDTNRGAVNTISSADVLSDEGIAQPQNSTDTIQYYRSPRAQQQAPNLFLKGGDTNVYITPNQQGAAPSQRQYPVYAPPITQNVTPITPFAAQPKQLRGGEGGLRGDPIGGPAYQDQGTVQGFEEATRLYMRHPGSRPGSAAAIGTQLNNEYDADAPDALDFSINK